MLFPTLLLTLSGITLPTTIFSLALATKPSASSVILPKPTGPLPVARSVVELIDHSRTQPFAPDTEPRRLMISVFYPVPHSTSQDLAPYMPALTARFEDSYIASFGLHTHNGTFEKLALHLSSPPPHSNTPSPSYPIALFLPGEGTTRLFYSQLASTIASNGYTVVTIDIPYDVDIVQYTDNTIAYLNQSILDPPTAKQLLANAALAVLTRAQDASFVLTSLANKTLAHSLVPTYPLNTTHAAMFGHSLGGAAALTALSLLNDDRLVGGVDMDGAFFQPTPPAMLGTSKPFLIMGHANHTRANSDPYNSWTTVWPHLTGWKRDIIIAETLHYDFSDYPIVFETLGITPAPKIAESEEVLIGSMKGTRALQIVTTYVTAFLDFVLAGKGSPLLDGPVAAFPEVTFEN